MLRAFLCTTGRGLAGQDRESDVCGSEARETALFPDVTERLGDGCFRECKSLEAVDFGAGFRIVEIGEKAFWRSSLRRLAVPDGVERMGYQCFCECKSLESVDFGPGSRLVEVEGVTLDRAWPRRVGLKDGVARVRPPRG